MSFYKKLKDLLMDQYRKMVVMHPSEEKSIQEIRNHLERFLGGSVDLVKNEENGLAVVLLNHEAKRNAISGKMMVDLHDIVENLESWKTGKGIILKGSHGNFCSGGDLNFVRQIANAEDGYMMATFMHHVLNKFQRLPLISVALIEGAGALGGGAEIATACDFRLMSESCNGFGFVHAKMGIIPAWGGTTRLVEKIGYTKALDMMSSAKVLKPRDCLKIGLVDEVIPSDVNTTEYSTLWLKERTKYDANVIRSIKISTSIARDFPLDFQSERRIFAPFWGSPGNKEALEKNIKHIDKKD